MNSDYALEVLEREIHVLQTSPENSQEKEQKLASLTFSIRVLKGYKEGVGRYDFQPLRD